MNKDKVPVELEIKVDGITKFVSKGYFGKDEPPLIQLPDKESMIKWINVQIEYKNHD